MLEPEFDPVITDEKNPWGLPKYIPLLEEEELVEAVDDESDLDIDIDEREEQD